MREELEKKLISRFPLLYGSDFHFECHDGWYDLIWKLSEEIYPEMERLRDDEMYATQVKSKYGSLRFYMSYYTFTIEQAIQKYRELSTETCEVCGKGGRLKKNGYWWRTACEDH